MEKAPALAEDFDDTAGNAHEVWTLILGEEETLHARMDVMKRRFLEASLQVIVLVP